MENNEHDNEQASQMSVDRHAPQPGADQVETQEVPIHPITIGDFCRRRSYDDLDELVKSIERNGLLHPVDATSDLDIRTWDTGSLVRFAGP